MSYITAIHYQIHNNNGSVRQVHSERKRLDSIYHVLNITEYDLTKMALPRYFPEIGITIIGYEVRNAT